MFWMWIYGYFSFFLLTFPSKLPSHTYVDDYAIRPVLAELCAGSVCLVWMRSASKHMHRWCQMRWRAISQCSSQIIVIIQMKQICIIFYRHYISFSSNVSTLRPCFVSSFLIQYFALSAHWSEHETSVWTARNKNDFHSEHSDLNSANIILNAANSLEISCKFEKKNLSRNLDVIFAWKCVL